MHAAYCKLQNESKCMTKEAKAMWRSIPLECKDDQHRAFPQCEGACAKPQPFLVQGSNATLQGICLGTHWELHFANDNSRCSETKTVASNLCFFPGDKMVSNPLNRHWSLAKPSAGILFTKKVETITTDFHLNIITIQVWQKMQKRTWEDLN